MERLEMLETEVAILKEKVALLEQQNKQKTVNDEDVCTFDEEELMEQLNKLIIKMPQFDFVKDC
jgi:hypothetical protein